MRKPGSPTTTKPEMEEVREATKALAIQPRDRMRKPGRPATTEREMREVREATKALAAQPHERISQKLHELLNELCLSIFKSPARLRHIRAVFQTITDPRFNKHHISYSSLSKLTSKNWPFMICPANTISAFIQGTRPDGSARIKTYLYLLHIMSKSNHPSLRGYICEALLDSCNDLRLFRAELNRDPSTYDFEDYHSILSAGRRLLSFLNTSTADNSKEYDILVNSSLLFGLEAASATKSGLCLTAIRLGSGSKEYYASQAHLNLLQENIDDGEKGQNERLLSVRTYTARRELKSRGFIVPRGLNFFFIQYHLDGGGINIVAMNNAELALPNKMFARGIILSTERRGSDLPVFSKIAIFPKKLEILGELEAHELAEKLETRDKYPLHMAESIHDYLHDADNIAIYGLSRDSAPLRIWGDIERELEGHKDKRRYKRRIRGFATGPFGAD